MGAAPFRAAASGKRVLRGFRRGKAEKALFLAIFRMDLETADQCIAKGVDINAKHEGMTVLMCAIEAKMEALCDKLIEKGADINATSDGPDLDGGRLDDRRVRNKHVLIYAVEAKLEALCIKMVEKGADVNCRYDGVMGMTVLMYAIKAKMEALCDKLIEKGADINAKSGRKPVLIYAVEAELHVLREKLIEMGAALHGWNGSDPRDVDFGKKIPDAILRMGREGWEGVIQFLRKLQGGAESNWAVKIDIVGTERAGKTSFKNALKSKEGRTVRINLENRTVGIEVDEMQLGNVVTVKVWDMAGQEVYRGLHSAFILPRCVAVIVYSPEEKYLEKNLRGWVQLIAAKAPGAKIVVVSTHSKSVKLEGRSVEDLAREMEKVVQSELLEVNSGVKDEVSRLERKIPDVQERRNEFKDAIELEELEKDLQRLREESLGASRNANEAGDLRERLHKMQTRRDAAKSLRGDIQDVKELEQLKKELEKELYAADERLRSLTESEAREGRRVVKKVSLLSERVWCVDSVKGDGVLELRETLARELEKLPFVGELVPAQWVRVKKIVNAEYARITQKAADSGRVLGAGKHLVKREELISWLHLEREEWKGMDATEAWEAVKFWCLQGDEWKDSGDYVLLDLRLLMELNKPLAFHCPGEALERLGRSCGEECDAMFVPDFQGLSDEDKTMVREAAKALEEKAELHESLLQQLYKWKEMSAEERQGLMEVMEETNFVSSVASAGGAGAQKMWVALLRLEWTFGGANMGTGIAVSKKDKEQRKGHPAAVYKLRFVPPGFYSQMVGSVLRMRNRYGAWREERRENQAMQVRFQVPDARYKKEHFLALSITEEGLEVRSSSMAMIERVCVPAEKLLGTQFPGINFAIQVCNMSQEHDAEWADFDGVKYRGDAEIAEYILAKAEGSKPRKGDHFNAAGLRAALADALTKDDGRVGGDIPFGGRVVKGARWDIVSFPGIHSYLWQKLTKNDKVSSNCVFFPEGHELFGQHHLLDESELRNLLVILCTDDRERQDTHRRIQDLKAGLRQQREKKVCYCMTLYPDHLRKQKTKPVFGCKWFEPWRVGFNEALDDKQQLIVVYQDILDPRSTYDLLGGSQRGEVRYAEGLLRKRDEDEIRARCKDEGKLQEFKRSGRRPEGMATPLCLKYVSVNNLRPLL